MNTTLMILCIAFGCIGILSTVFSIFSSQSDKRKIKAQNNVIQHKDNAIESLQNENAFLNYVMSKRENWLEDVLNS